jgi:Protein CHAPERONE-LIKE PROTEIN OF POR1-like
MPSSFQPLSTSNQPNWLKRLVDIPNRRELLNSLGSFATIGLLHYIIPTATNIWLSFAVLISIYFLRVKENKFGRSVLLAFAGLLVGIAIASILNFLPPFPFANYVWMVIVLLVMWLVTAFLR